MVKTNQADPSARLPGRIEKNSSPEAAPKTERPPSRNAAQQTEYTTICARIGVVPLELRLDAGAFAAF